MYLILLIMIMNIKTNLEVVIFGTKIIKFNYFGIYGNQTKTKKDYIITNEKLFDLTLNKDLNQIEKDWNFIITKIKEGKAHEISEADTMYLGACSKGANSSSLRSQPFSKLPAMQRAFCFKVSYMTQLVRSCIGNYNNIEKILKGNEDSFDQFILNAITKYKDKTKTQLMNEFNIESKAKNVNRMIISRMFGVTNIAETDEFKKANIIPKTIRIEQNGTIKESVSFPAFKYMDIISQDWEESELKEELESTKYMFFVFKETDNDYKFQGIKLWNMPETIIESNVKTMWNKTKNVIATGNIVKSINSKGVRKTNFLGMHENPVCHVRPHARDSKDTFKLPVPDKLTGLTEYTKQCFWLNNTYLKEILKDFM